MQNLDSHPEYTEKQSTAVVNGGASTAIGENNPPPKKDRERRSSPREQYQYIQSVAPMHGHSTPATNDFIKVEFKDLSRGGVSFFLKRPPACKFFTVALGGKNSSSTMLIAKVIRSQEVEHNEKHMYLVGCKFINRLPHSNFGQDV
jgi:hypothetical protein